MSFVYDPQKAIQIVALVLKNSPDHRLSRLKLMKLLYIADRESICETGFPISGDRLVAMKHGPVLSKIYAQIRGSLNSSEWDKHIVNDHLNLKLISDPGIGKLTPYEVAKLERVTAAYSAFSASKLRNLTHDLPEWRKNNPGKSVKDIPLADIVTALGKQDDLESIARNKREEEYFSHSFRG